MHPAVRKLALSRVGPKPAVLNLDPNARQDRKQDLSLGLNQDPNHPLPTALQATHG